MKKVFITYNTSHHVVLSRLNLIGALQASGYQVIVLSPVDAYTSRLLDIGVEHIPVSVDSKGINPVKDLHLCYRYLKLFYHHKPYVVLHYTIKPNIYGGLACRLLGLPSVHNISGLGTAFITTSWLTRLVRQLYRFSLAKSQKIFFQNPDDLNLFVQNKLVTKVQVEQLPGSGVDTVLFAPIDTSTNQHRDKFIFLLSARLLWDKGVGEFVEATRLLISEGKNLECHLLGFLGVENRTAIPSNIVKQWESEGVVHYLGGTDDVRNTIAESDCVVLPSYREGTPRSLLEAASMAKPVITTDTVGCREVVDDGLTGYLCRLRDADDLADKMRQMIDLPYEERIAMGQRGREKMVREFKEQFVIDRYLSIVGKFDGL